MKFFKIYIPTPLGILIIVIEVFIAVLIMNFMVNDMQKELMPEMDNIKTIISHQTTNVNVNQAVDTADWQTYRNEALGYSIKYPTNWSLSETQTTTVGNMVIIEPPDAAKKSTMETGPGVGIYAYDHIVSDYATNKRTEIINGIEVIRQYESGLTTTNVTYFPTKTGYIRVTWDYSFESDYPEYKEVLSTFQFTDETAGWETYRNEDLGIKFNYPQSIATPTVSPGINGNESLPVKEWQDVVMTVGSSSLSFTTRQNYYGRYESAWNNTSYSKGVDLDQDLNEIKTTLSEDFRNIDGLLTVANSFVEFYELGQYGEDYSLLYRAIKPSSRYGSIVGTYVIKGNFYSESTENYETSQEAINRFTNEISLIQDKNYNQDVLSAIQVLRGIMLSLSDNK